MAFQANMESGARDNHLIYLEPRNIVSDKVPNVSSNRIVRKLRQRNELKRSPSRLCLRLREFKSVT